MFVSIYVNKKNGHLAFTVIFMKKTEGAVGGFYNECFAPVYTNYLCSFPLTATR